MESEFNCLLPEPSVQFDACDLADVAFLVHVDEFDVELVDVVIIGAEVNVVGIEHWDVLVGNVKKRGSTPCLPSLRRPPFPRPSSAYTRDFLCL